MGGNYRDGLLRAYSDEKHTTGYVIDSKLLWSLGNYSRFVRPEAVRHDVVTSEAEDPYGVMCSAFRNADGRWVAVVINYGERQRDFSLSTSDQSTRDGITAAMFSRCALLFRVASFFTISDTSPAPSVFASSSCTGILADPYIAARSSSFRFRMVVRFSFSVGCTMMCDT